MKEMVKFAHIGSFASFPAAWDRQFAVREDARAAFAEIFLPDGQRCSQRNEAGAAAGENYCGEKRT